MTFIIGAYYVFTVRKLFRLINSVHQKPKSSRISVLKHNAPCIHLAIHTNCQYLLLPAREAMRSETNQWDNLHHLLAHGQPRMAILIKYVVPDTKKVANSIVKRVPFSISVVIYFSQNDFPRDH